MGTTWRPLTAEEQEEYLSGGKAPGDVATGLYLRLFVEGAQDVPADGHLYLIKEV